LGSRTGSKRPDATRATPLAPIATPYGRTRGRRTMSGIIGLFRPGVASYPSRLMAGRGGALGGHGRRGPGTERGMEYVNEVRLRETLHEDRRAYATAEPFPHIVLDGFLRDHVAAALEAEFPKVDHRLWKHHLHFHSHKFACNRWAAMPPLFQAVLGELNSLPMLAYLEALTGIPDLGADDDL